MSCENCAQDKAAGYAYCYRCGTALNKVVAPAQASDPSAVVPLPVPLPQTKRCPFCAEVIAAEARKCKHCGEFLDARSPTIRNAGMFQGLSPYYQQEFQQIMDSGEQYEGQWNWAAFCFGGFWALSKGLLKPGFVSIVGAMLTSGIVGIIYWFIFGARGNYMYYSKVVKGDVPWI